MKNKILTISIVALIAIISILIIYNFTKSPTGDLKEISYKEIIKKQKNKEDFILIVSRSDCSHCVTYKPKVKQLAEEYNFIAYYINFDMLSDEEEFLNALNLSGATPTTLFFKNGKETSILNRLEGDQQAKIIREHFKKMGFID